LSNHFMQSLAAGLPLSQGCLLVGFGAVLLPRDHCRPSHLVLWSSDDRTGVDMAVATIGSGCAKVISDTFKVDARTRALYIQAGLSAALSIFLPSPILGLLLIQELNGVTRPGRLTLSSAVSPQSSALAEESTAEIQNLVNHDLMEQVLISTITAASANAVVQILFPEPAVEAMRMQNYTFPTSSSENGYNAYLDWLRAIPLGLLSGSIVTLTGVIYLKWSWTRVKGCAFLMYNERLKFTRGRQIFATLGGLICGVLGFVWSYPLLFDNGVNAWQNVLDAKAEGLSAYEVLHFGLHVMLGIAVCMGCGILGGCAFPMLTVGACLGVGISCHFFPLALSVPCCMAGSISGFLPAPFTTVLTVSVMFNLDPNQCTSVLIATLASYTVTGGSGVVRRLSRCAWKMAIEEDMDVLMESEDEDVTPQDVEIQEGRPLADYEIRQEIRSKIFGSPSTDGED
jgi:H+/Cl- antiporter ClcA